MPTGCGSPIIRRDALNYIRQALDSLHRLETLAPNNAEYRRLDSSAQLVLANSFVRGWRLARQPGRVPAFGSFHGDCH